MEGEALQAFLGGGLSHVPCEGRSCKVQVCLLEQGLTPRSKTAPRAPRRFLGRLSVITGIAHKTHPTRGGLETVDF